MFWWLLAECLMGKKSPSIGKTSTHGVWCETCQPQNTSHLLPSPNPTCWSDLFHLANPAISSNWSKKGSSKQLCQENLGAPSSATAVREMVARSWGLRALQEISSFVVAGATSANKTMAQNKSTSGSQTCHIFWLFLCRRCPGPVFKPDVGETGSEQETACHDSASLVWSKRLLPYEWLLCLLSGPALPHSINSLKLKSNIKMSGS